jgi:SAM-dependent methyltransferase
LRHIAKTGEEACKVTLDVNSPAETWAYFNAIPGVEHLARASLIAPFPPPDLMQRVSGLTQQKDFAQHGKDIFLALSRASPKPLASFESILDFGVGSGRLARMFKGFKGRYFGADIDHELVNWTSSAMNWVSPMRTSSKEALPCPAAAFDLVISVSVFTHMNEQDSEFYLRELRRVTQPGATLLLTVHGERALERAETEAGILQMLGIERAGIDEARRRMQSPGFTFIIQPNGHLTTDRYDYGISFTGESYIESTWAKLFTVEKIDFSTIYDFQDIVVLSR